MAKDRFLFKTAGVEFRIEDNCLVLDCAGEKFYFSAEETEEIVTNLNDVLDIQIVRRVAFKDQK